MKIIMIVLRNLVYSFIVISILFVFLSSLFLFMNIKTGLIFSIIFILFSLSIFCYCIYAFVWGKKPFQFLFLNGISGLFSLAAIVLTLTFVTLYFFSINLLISTELGKKLTLEEKLVLYMLPFQENQNTADYNAMKAGKLTTTYQHVDIYYHPHEKALLPIIEQILDQADSSTTGLLGTVKDNEIDLILHSSSEELYERTSLIETMGYFDDPNDIIGVAISDLEEILSERMPDSFYFRSTIMHEYTHYRLQAFIKEQGLFVYRIPLWFHEGVAEFIGMHDVPHPYYSIKETAFKNLETHEEWEKYRLDDYDVYLQSYYAIRYLVDHYGETVIKAIIKETAIENDFNKGFSKATGITVEELQEHYLSDTKKEF